MMQMDVHLIQRPLHVLDLHSTPGYQIAPVPQIRPQYADVIGGSKRSA
jgi:hypothetical protein